MVRKRKATGKEPQIHERVERVPELTFAGLVERFWPARSEGMPSLWERLGAVRGFEGQLADAVHALSTRAYAEDGSFDYMVALQVALRSGTQSNSELYRFDQEHLSAKAYSLWTGIIRPRLLKDLESP